MFLKQFTLVKILAKSGFKGHFEGQLRRHGLIGLELFLIVLYIIYRSNLTLYMKLYKTLLTILSILYNILPGYWFTRMN